jgi:hypothetical protein
MFDATVSAALLYQVIAKIQESLVKNWNHSFRWHLHQPRGSCYKTYNAVPQGVSSWWTIAGFKTFNVEP